MVTLLINPNGPVYSACVSPNSQHAYVSVYNIHLITFQEKPVKLMERSIYSAKYCFVENLHNRYFILKYFKSIYI